MAANIRNDKFARSVYVTVWTGLSENDRNGDPESLVQAADRTVQVTGTFGGATVVIEGSNIAVPNLATNDDWFQLTTPAGTNVSFTSAGGALIAENPLHIRPRVSGGTNTDISVDLVSRSSR